MIKQLSFLEVDKIKDSALKFIDQTGYQYGFDLKYFLGRMKELVANGVVVIFADIQGDQATSAIGFTVGQDLYSNYRLMAEIFFYGEGASGVKCLRFAEDFATRANIKQIVLATTTYNEDRNAAYYQRLGYKKDSSTYRKELNDH